MQMSCLSESYFQKRESRCDVCVGCVTCFLGNKYFQVGVMGWCFVVKMVAEPKYYADEVIGHPNHHLRI